MCPPCPRPPVHHVPGTYTGRHGRQRLSKHVRSRDGRFRRQACVEARPTSAAGRAGPPEASSSSLSGSIESVLLRESLRDSLRFPRRPRYSGGATDVKVTFLKPPIGGI